MLDEELLKLYAEDLEERKKFFQLKNETDKIQMSKTMEVNAVIRCELVAECSINVQSSY